MVEAVRRYDGRMSTGFMSTLRMMMELSRYGFNDVAHTLAGSHRLPSWGYSIDQGATTIWERWDAYVAGRGFQDAGMNSFNHYSFGSVVEWMYRTILGINYDEQHPGYRHFILRPVPGGSLQWARGWYHSISGTIGVDWKLANGHFLLTLDVPPNTEATLHLPTTDPAGIVESDFSGATPKGVIPLRAEPGAALFQLASGRYCFDSPLDSARWADLNRIPFAFVPGITPSESVFRVPASGTVEIKCETPGASVRYTLDGSEPTEQSPQYTGPVKITRAATVKAKAFKEGLKPSITASASYDIIDGAVNGLNYLYYEGAGWQKIPDFAQLTPVSKGVVDRI